MISPVVHYSFHKENDIMDEKINLYKNIKLEVNCSEMAEYDINRNVKQIRQSLDELWSVSDEFERVKLQSKIGYYLWEITVLTEYDMSKKQIRDNYDAISEETSGNVDVEKSPIKWDF